MDLAIEKYLKFWKMDSFSNTLIQFKIFHFYNPGGGVPVHKKTAGGGRDNLLVAGASPEKSWRPFWTHILASF